MQKGLIADRISHGGGGGDNQCLCCSLWDSDFRCAMCMLLGLGMFSIGRGDHTKLIVRHPGFDT